MTTNLTTTVSGAHTSALIFTDEVEGKALESIQELCNSPYLDGCKIRVMPDVHAGVKSVIGWTQEVREWVAPQTVGVDVGCGVSAQKARFHKIDSTVFQAIDSFIRKEIPSGFSINNNVQPLALEFYEAHQRGEGRFHDICRRIGKTDKEVLRQIGSLGGGNHFLSVNEDPKTGAHYIVVHSGSRNFGLQVCNFHAKKAKDTEGFLHGEDLQEYLQDMKIAQEFAHCSRKQMLDKICHFLEEQNLIEWEAGDWVESVHNYIEISEGSAPSVIRKGAISAKQGERLLIPISMAEGIILGTGKGNPDWNCSAPHGAGRLMSRTKANETLTLSEFQARMEAAGVWSSCVSENTLDESPMAYKGLHAILSRIDDSVEVQSVLKEVYNFKAEEKPIGGWRKKKLEQK